MDDSDESNNMDDSEIVRQFEKSNFESFLCTVITFGTLNIIEKKYVESEMLDISAN